MAALKSVSQFPAYLPTLLSYLHNECANFEAGRVSKFLPTWKTLTHDPEILMTVTGVHIELDELPEPPKPRSAQFTEKEREVITAEIKKLLAKRVLELASPEPGQIISPIFLIPKPDGTHRMILNLKHFNNYVTYRHFKVDTLSTITQLMSPQCFMALLDLKDAYYSIPIAPQHRKFLRFEFNGQLLQYTCCANGLSSCPRLFTKVLKPALTMLHKQGHIATAYIDDIYVQGVDFDSCSKALIDAVAIFTKLGFIIHPSKSAFVPSKEIKMLGFLLNSDNMTVRPTQEKKDSIISVCQGLLGKETTKIRTVAQIIGKIVSLFPGELYGPLHYRQIDREKTAALRASRGNFDSNMSLSVQAQDELKWWISSVNQAHRPLIRPHYSLLITTDASSNGWGAVCNGTSTGGLWTAFERAQHINYLEMLAILFGLKIFASSCSNVHVRVMTDNTTAVSVISHMGSSRSKTCNDLCKTIWNWCISRNLWLSVAHIPGKQNFYADYESRKKTVTSAEWQLNPNILNSCFRHLRTAPQIDLFASRINCQMDCFVSFKPDPEAYAVDAFTLNWGAYDFYAFPPFSLVSRLLNKIELDGAEGICVLPDWPTQPWYAKARQMMQTAPIILKPSKNLLKLPTQPEVPHPLHSKLQLLVCHLSAPN